MNPTDRFIPVHKKSNHAHSARMEHSRQRDVNKKKASCWLLNKKLNTGCWGAFSSTGAQLFFHHFYKGVPQWSITAQWCAQSTWLFVTAICLETNMLNDLVLLVKYGGWQPEINACSEPANTIYQPCLKVSIVTYRHYHSVVSLIQAHILNWQQSG